ncbi:PfkB family carbohydrate kinase [Amycolatopsis pithecellobii]|uniref:Adenylyltransferase/cytidyltransferase family protein n=1 Tax=Amycolatopsis pithecellobii TaxID=664692 RepID=A0A6N7Z177_9PSEU|nr:PfkB family carbohydrate kinase [Amycolatopsis pithecellobii]MTD53390.1 adenylyltransferase/cytidyltransferase family protein [Amycolatopsis pithecellobii]
MNPLVVVGDAILDVDVEGRADRLCPEAPVPVVDVTRRRYRPGGAGLAALLAAQSTSDVELVAALGDDESGTTLGELLSSRVRVHRLPLRGSTVRKTRVRAAGQSMLRVDDGDGTAANEPLSAEVVAAVRAAGAILVADYGRGVAAHPELRRLLTELARRVPVVWDPHPRGPEPVRGAQLVTPNSAEAKGFAPAYTEPAELAKVLRDEWGADSVAITTGASGALLANGKRVSQVEVPAGLGNTGHDTCGAGDRFASAAAAALLDGYTVAEAVAAGVETAASFVADGGASALSLSQPGHRAPATPAFELASRVRGSGGRLVATGGCFDLVHPGHLTLLRRARELGDALVVCLNSDDSVRRLKGEGRPIVPAADRARLLAELSCVDAVLTFDETSPARLLDRLRPDVWVKGGDYTEAELPESEVVRRHGGEIVLVPAVPGYSTTRLIAIARGREGER